MDLKKITKILLFITLFVPLFVVADSLLFPYVSGKVYLFRALVEVSFLFWLALIIKKPEYRPNLKNPLIVTTLLLFSGVVVTALLGIDPVRSFFSDFERGQGVIHFAHWVLYFLMITSVFRTKKDIRNFIGLFLISAVLIAVWGWTQDQYKLYGTFGNPAYLAGFLIFALGFAGIALERSYFAVFRKKIIQLLIFSALIGFFCISLFSTGIRGALAGATIAFVFFTIFSIIFLRREKKWLTIISASALGVIVIFTGIALAYRDSDFFQEHSLLRSYSNIVGVWESDSFQQRYRNWQISIKAFEERPLTGWGMENFQNPFNKYYDYRTGLKEPWFDRVHNQAFQYLVDGGIILFFLYLLWIGVFFYSSIKIAKKFKTFGAILASIFIGYLIQSLFLFDTFPIYAGLFSLLFITTVSYDSLYEKEFKKERGNGGEIGKQGGSWKKKTVLTFAFIFVLFSLYNVAFLPYKANRIMLDHHVALLENRFQDAKNQLEKAFDIKSPYTYFTARNQAGWEFMQLLDLVNIEKTSKENMEAVKEIEQLYEFVIPELERALDYRPTDTQIYYLLAKLYRLGFEKLDKNNLSRAEKILEKARELSSTRLEYFDELSRILILGKKYEKVEKITQDYTESIGSERPLPQAILGHLYFVEGKYELAMKHYDKARESGYNFIEKEGEYDRYLTTAEKMGDYQKVVEMSLEYLEVYGSDGATFFNLAVSYRELKNYEKAKEFFKRAVEMNKKYEKYRSYFENIQQ